MKWDNSKVLWVHRINQNQSGPVGKTEPRCHAHRENEYGELIGKSQEDKSKSGNDHAINIWHQAAALGLTAGGKLGVLGSHKLTEVGARNGDPDPLGRGYCLAASLSL